MNRKLFFTIVFTFFCCIFSCAQKIEYDNYDYNELIPSVDGLRRVEDINEIKVSPDVAYNICKTWLFNNIKSDEAKPELTLDDPSDHHIMGKAILAYYTKVFLSTRLNKMHLMFDIKIKEGKYRIRFYDFQNEVFQSVANGMSTKVGTYKIEEMIKEINSGISKKQNQQALIKLNELLTKSSDNLKKDLDTNTNDDF